MTLIELLVSVVVIGAIATVLAAAVTVTFRQQDSTEARLEVARWEQGLALWLPGDLTSATNVSAAEGEQPCGDPICSFGSNALLLSWDDGSGPTVVSYRYGPAEYGTTFVLTRVECHAGSCSSQVVLRDLAPPTDDAGNLIPWNPGDKVPDNVIDVTVPLLVTETSPGGSTDTTSRAQRVIVNVNGAPGNGGQNYSSTVSFTAGGSALGELEPATFSGPTFLQANSGCGGPVTLIVDDSGSIGGQIDNVRTGVRSFVQAFEGTPTRLQIIRFDTTSSTLGTTGWNKFYDLAEPSDVSALIGPTGTGGLVSSLSAGGGTNWEDALHRAFYSQNGQTYDQLGNPNAPTPELVVFFTDGVPTFDRLYASTDTSSVGPASTPSRFDHTTAGNSGYGTDFSPRGWYRADYILDQFRDIRTIGVGVGAAFSQSHGVNRSGWPAEPPYSWAWWTVPTQIPNEVFLGDLTSGGDPSQYPGGASGNYIKRQYSSSGGWGDVSTADLLVTSQWSQFGSALTEIALAECGGTLTVQTRNQAGQPADADITYQVGDKVVTTTRISKAGTFDIPLSGVASATVELIPQSFDGTGYTPQSWACRARGSDLPQGGSWQLLQAGSPGAGISVTVAADQAVSCTLSVSP
ncbi:MAG: hypothetical protein KDB37_03555 [Ilumatobacter sp.]|nr:hypothetical protein [Ilumatobacter sp.]